MYYVYIGVTTHRNLYRIAVIDGLKEAEFNALAVSDYADQPVVKNHAKLLQQRTEGEKPPAMIVRRGRTDDVLAICYSGQGNGYAANLIPGFWPNLEREIRKGIMKALERQGEINGRPCHRMAWSRLERVLGCVMKFGAGMDDIVFDVFEQSEKTQAPQQPNLSL